MVALTYNIDIWEAEAGALCIQCLHGPCIQIISEKKPKIIITNHNIKYAMQARGA